MKQLQEHVYTDDNGVTRKLFVDQDGAIIDELYLTQRWIKPGQSVFVRDHHDKEERQEESLGRSPYHIKLYRTNLQHILRTDKLSKNARATLLSCVAHVGWNDNTIVDAKGAPITGRELAALTGLDRNTVQRGLAELQEKEIVAVLPDTQHYVVNPSVTWMGVRSAKNVNQTSQFLKKLPVSVKYRKAPTIQS